MSDLNYVLSNIPNLSMRDASIVRSFLDALGIWGMTERCNFQFNTKLEKLHCQWNLREGERFVIILKFQKSEVLLIHDRENDRESKTISIQFSFFKRNFPNILTSQFRLNIDDLC